MRGKPDEAAGVLETEAAAQGEDSPMEASRPVGGKALLRLVQLLDSAQPGAASEVVSRAVGDEAVDAFRSTAARFEAGGETVGTGRGKPRGRRAAARKAASSDIDVEEIGQLYLDVATDILGPPTTTGPQWRSLGPWTITNGQTYGTSRVNVSGRVAAIAVDPRNPAHVLVGAANGGVWESKDRGASWAPRTDYAATLAVGALAFDPSNPAIVYCGTGEGNWWSYLGAGVLRSTDGGTTWTTRCTTPFVGQGFYDLVVDPHNGNRLFAATSGGLYQSTDGGATWTQRRPVTTWKVEITPPGGRSARILAACRDGLFRSTNGGSTWTAVPLPNPPASFTRLAVSICPSHPAVAYAWGAGPPFVGPSQTPTAYLWRRAGGNWSTVTPPPGVNTAQAWYDWYVAAAPDVDTEVYLAAIDLYRGDLSGSTWTWRDLSTKGPGADSVHPDQHAIAFEPGAPNTIYAGNDGGLFRSGDRGITWQHCNNGLVISEFEYIAQDCGSSRWLIGGTQDNGTDRWTGPATWEHVQDGDGGDVGVNRTDPTIVFHTFYGMSPERSMSRGDWGTWTSIQPPIPAGEGSLFYPPFECSASGGNTVGIGGSAVYISRDNGSTWARLAFPAAATASAMYIPNPDTAYVGTTNGGIYRTSWSGTAWGALVALTSPPAGGYISDLHADSAAPPRIWATYRTFGAQRVFRSDDGGTSWTDCSAGLPTLPMNAVEVDTANRQRIWVAADLGVYQSWDAGATWATFSDSLPNCYIGDLVFHPNARVLRAGTRNRGVWEIPVDGWMTQPQCGVQWTGSLPGNGSNRWFTFNWPATWHVIWNVMPTNPRPGSAQVTWNVQVERATAEFVTYWITVRNLTPDPLTFEGRFCILSRY